MGNNAHHVVTCDGTDATAVLGGFVITAGQADGGGTSNCDAVSPRLVNCVLTANTAPDGPGMLFTGGAAPAVLTMANSIVRNGPAWLSNQNGSTAAIRHSDVEGGWPGESNIESAPLFMRTASPGSDGIGGTVDDDYGDLRLRAGSPCIDGGRNADVPSSVLFDLDGFPRFIDEPVTPDCRYVPDACGGAPIVDMGAYEYRPPVASDFDHDGNVDLNDFVIFAGCLGGPGVAPTPQCVAADLTADNDVDLADFTEFQAASTGSTK